MRMTRVLISLLTDENFEIITKNILAGTTLKKSNDGKVEDTSGDKVKNKNGGGTKKQEEQEEQ